MEKTKSQPTQFTLHGDRTEISFETTSINGTARFSYKSGEKQLQFAGSDVRVMDTEFGKLVTVTIDDGTDGGDSSVTLLHPKFSSIAVGEEAQYKTIAIVTAVRRLGPAHQLYRVVNLQGTARVVVS